jgi:large subunit ribosomal protein L29
MASKAAAAMTSMTDAELVAKLAETKAELFNLRFQRATGTLENLARIGILKKDVARVNTMLRAREIAAAEALAAGAGQKTSAKVK